MTPEQIAKLIEANKRDLEDLRKYTRWTVNTQVNALRDIVQSQQQMIDYLLERDRQREGDGK